MRVRAICLQDLEIGFIRFPALLLLVSGWVSAQEPVQLPSLPPVDGERKIQPVVAPPDLQVGDRKRKVVIIRDGDSWYFDAFAERVKTELVSLSRESYEVSFEDFNASNDLNAAAQALETALVDNTTDLIVAAGYAITQKALELPEAKRTRPILGGAVEFSNMLASSISREGTSKVSNYSFITNPQRVASDLNALKDLSGERTVQVLVDQRFFRMRASSADFEAEKRRIEEKTGLSARLVEAGGSANQILSSMPSTPKAVYVTILPYLPPSERVKLFEGLAERGHISLSMVGLSDVKIGAMSGLAPENGELIAKRAALNAHQILLGIDPTVLPVYLPMEDRFVINRQAGEMAGWSPDYETALIAEFIDDGSEVGEPLSLEEAMGMAACGNANVKIQKEQEGISRADLATAESFRRPTIDLELQQSFTDYTDRINRQTTPDHLNAGSYGLALRQSLFNDTIRSNIGSALESVAAEKLNTRSEQLDAMEEAGIAFLNYLSARALWEIDKENHRLTENNLRLARLRVSLGAAEPSEVFRWEQDAASSRASVFQSEASRENARIELNRILGQPREKRWTFVDIELEDGDTYFMGNVLKGYIQNQADAERFGEFLREVSVPSSPELAAFDFGLSAQGVQLESVERSFFLPEIAGFISYNRTGQGTEQLDFSSQGETQAGVSLTFPIYEGGLRTAELDGQRAVVRQLAAQRERSLQLIEQRALVSHNGLMSEYPNIRLSRMGLEAAEKNYESVREKYAKGAATILDLLDAQAALLRQRQQASLAVYTYLQELVSMQRSIAWFEFEKKSDQNRKWEKMFAAYMVEGRLSVPKVAEPDPNREMIQNRAGSVIRKAGGSLEAKPVPQATARRVEPNNPANQKEESLRKGMFKRWLPSQ